VAHSGWLARGAHEVDGILGGGWAGE